jgi:hypothetical protein
MLIKRRGNQVGKRLWFYFSLLLDGIHIDPIAEALPTRCHYVRRQVVNPTTVNSQGRHVSGQSRQANIYPVSYRKYLTSNHA